MEIIDTQTLLETKVSGDQVEGLFESLSPVSIEFMLGRWRGTELRTGHPLDGRLRRSGWYGKAFLSAEEVHPLLFWNADKSGIFSVNPKRMLMSAFRVASRERLKVPRGAARALRAMKSVMATSEARARLRLLEHKGQVSAAMIYDDLPIIDLFKRIDEARVLGRMDCRGVVLPYFFVLTRDDETALDVPY